MQKTVVLNVVGLTQRLLETALPRLRQWASSGQAIPIKPVLPAVTCSVQASYLTGCYPDEHGIVGNGWYVRDECEVKFWKQSNHLIQRPKLWECARALDKNFTCANLFWWFNMYSSVDISVTPRPMYLADGRKIPDIYTHPADLREVLQNQLGQFPLFDFWGPRASIKSSQWIADAARLVEASYAPTLTLIYLPHLDYGLQKQGLDLTALQPDLQQIDALASELIAFYEAQGAAVIVLSEYGITPVDQPVSLNRPLRQHNLLQVRVEQGRELLDAGASAAFAVADHQIAHVYVNDKSKLHRVRSILEATPGVAQVLDSEGLRSYRLQHARAGDLVAVAAPNAWFTYYYWENDRRAPDFARTVDIHRKPGYDPVELFLDPALRWPMLAVGQRLLKRKLGFRTLLNVIALDPNLVKGSHGCLPQSALDAPIFISRRGAGREGEAIQAPQVHDFILEQLFSAALPQLFSGRKEQPHFSSHILQ